MPALSIKFTLALLLAVVASSMTLDVSALSLEKLLMPGPLTDAHAELEDDCSTCHGETKQSDQTNLCLACHDHSDIADDIARRTGFHGRSTNARSSPCRECHKEHLGRSADIILLDAAAFDHSLTDFPLRGAHTGASCGSCHETQQAFRDAPEQCAGCHEKDDAHRGNLGDQCGDCHSEERWADAQFDHDKTEFPLRGEHSRVSCELCHTAQRYEGTDKQCSSCHRTQDVHRGKNGKRCENCHTPKDWKTVKFDHSRTDFPLLGKHRQVSCRTCHRKPLYQEELATECVACHRVDDVHRGRNGDDCKACHVSDSWTKSQFDHDKDTKFALRGQHRKLPCESCHVEDAYRTKLQSDCYACHREDDVHEGQEGKLCENCHSETAWGDNVFFEHDLTTFPLIGMHATTPCEQCHLTLTYKHTESDCYVCHASDDAHERRLGTGCDLCHNPNDWLLWLFDHNEQTDFEINGAHAELRCEHCHRLATDARQPDQLNACVSCHRADDAHRGRFGASCNRCHTTKTFREATVR